MSEKVKEILVVIGCLVFLAAMIAAIVFDSIQVQKTKDLERALVRNCTATGYQRVEKRGSASFGLSTSGNLVAVPTDEIIIHNEYLCPDGTKRYAQ